MAGEHSYQAGVIFASLVGAAGFPLAVLAWRRFRGTPFGRILAVLPVFMFVVAFYHPVLLVYPSLLEFALLVETAGFALLVLFAVQAIRVHRRMSPRGSRGGRGGRGSAGSETGGR